MKLKTSSLKDNQHCQHWQTFSQTHLEKKGESCFFDIVLCELFAYSGDQSLVGCIACKFLLFWKLYVYRMEHYSAIIKNETMPCEAI